MRGSQDYQISSWEIIASCYEKPHQQKHFTSYSTNRLYPSMNKSITFQASMIDTIQTFTKKRLSIIGDEDQKQALAIDVAFQTELYQLMADQTSTINFEVLKNCLLIINSLSYNRDFDSDGTFQGFMIRYIEEHADDENEDNQDLPESLGSQQTEVFKLMLLSLNKLRIRDELVTPIFKDYLNYKLLTARGEEVVLLIVKYLINLTNPERRGLNELTGFDHGYLEFVPHLLHLYSRALVKDVAYSNEIFYLINNYLESKHFTGCEYFLDFEKVVNVMKKKIVKSGNLFVISNYVNYFIKSRGHQSYKKRLVHDQEMLQFLKLKILPILLNDKALFKSKVNTKINSIFLLKNISMNFPILNKSLIDSNIIETFLNYLKATSVHSYGSLSSKSLDASIIEMNITNIFMIFSSIASNDEANRDMIINSNGVVLNNIESILTSYHNLREKRIQLQRKSPSKARKSINHELALSSLYLLRSLSRSIVNLRKYLIDLKIPGVLIGLVKPPIPEGNGKEEEQDDDESNYINTNSVDENLVVSLTLSILSNLILEFSPLRQQFLQLDLISVLRFYLENGTEPSNSIDFNIKLNSLWVIRHLIYNEKLKFKEDIIMNQISLVVLFQYLKDDVEIELQEQSLNILRNLTSNCNKTQITKILHMYQIIETEQPLDLKRLNEDCLFFKLMISKLQSDDSSVQANESIIYICAHILKSNEKFRNILIENTELLEIMKDILKSNQTIDALKTAAIWFLINLTWLDNSRARRGSFTASDDDEDETMSNSIDADAVRRINVLNQLGFKETLKGLLGDIEVKLNNGGVPNVDLKDRVKTVLSTLETN